MGFDSVAWKTNLQTGFVSETRKTMKRNGFLWIIFLHWLVLVLLCMVRFREVSTFFLFFVFLKWCYNFMKMPLFGKSRVCTHFPNRWVWNIYGWMKALLAPCFLSQVYIILGMVCAVRWHQPRAGGEQQCPGPCSQDTLWSQMPRGGWFGLTQPDLCRAPWTSTWRDLLTPQTPCTATSTAQRDWAEARYLLQP